MAKQEKSKWKGGLLGDEMGMGKTIQAVSLIMSDYPAKDPTLVVVVSSRQSCSCTALVLSDRFIISTLNFHQNVAVFFSYEYKLCPHLFKGHRSKVKH